jgi:hypothetical protein
LGDSLLENRSALSVENDSILQFEAVSDHDRTHKTQMMTSEQEFLSFMDNNNFAYQRIDIRCFYLRQRFASCGRGR